MMHCPLKWLKLCITKKLAEINKITLFPKYYYKPVAILDAILKKMTLKLKNETDIHPGDESGSIVQCLVVDVSL